MAGLLQVTKIYLKYLAGLISWWEPPQGTVFNIPLFTGVWCRHLMGSESIRFGQH